MSPKQPEKSKSYLPFIIIVGVLAVAVVAALLLMRSGNNNLNAQTQNGSAGLAGQTGGKTGTPATTATQQPVSRTTQPGAQPPHEIGGKQAQVVLEEFSDFQCPACARVHPSLKRIEDEYGDRIKVIFRNFPLQQIHKNAFSAARAAEAAGLQGRFWEMHDMLFQTQDEWKDSSEPRPIFALYANRLGLNVEKFKADMERQDIADRVRSDYARGMSLGVKGTPTIFINGRELPAEQTLVEQNLRAQVEAALAEAGRAK